MALPRRRLLVAAVLLAAAFPLLFLCPAGKNRRNAQRGGDGGRELRPRGEQPAEPGGGGAAAEAAGRGAGEAVRRRPDRAARAGQHGHQGGRLAAQRAAVRGGVARLVRAPVGAPQRGGLLPGDADPRHRCGQRGVRVGQERHGAVGHGHGQRAHRAGQARARRRRQGVVAHRAHRARGVASVFRQLEGRVWASHASGRLVVAAIGIVAEVGASACHHASRDGGGATRRRGLGGGERRTRIVAHRGDRRWAGSEVGASAWRFVARPLHVAAGSEVGAKVVARRLHVAAGSEVGASAWRSQVVARRLHVTAGSEVGASAWLSQVVARRLHVAAGSEVGASAWRSQVVTRRVIVEASAWRLN